MTVKTKAGRRKTGRARLWAPNWLGSTFGFVWLLVVLIPLYYVVVTSLKSVQGFFEVSAIVPPSNPTGANYKLVLENDILLYFGNSLIVAAGTVVPTVTFAFMAAYAVVRSRSKLASGANTILLLGLSIPLQATVIPLYYMIINMGLYDNLLALIIPAIAVSLPVSFLILSNFLRNIPKELFESMRLDGCSEWAIMWRLALPLSRASIMTVAIYETVRSWNAFLLPLIMTQSQTKRTIPLSLWSYSDEFVVNTPAVASAIVLSVMPLLLFYIVGRKQLVGGLTAGFSK